MKVLQIDDSPQICEMYADMFTADKNSIESVNDGKDGLNMVIKNDYDLVLLDIRMPEYSGVDFLRDLKKHRPSELKKIVVTSMLEMNETQMEELMKFGIHSIEKKPTNFQQLKTLKESVSPKLSPETPRILLIDSKLENAANFSEFFNSKGFETIVTDDPWKGFRLIQKDHFDVILLDINMPKFGGLHVIKMLATDEILQHQNIFILPDPFGHNNQIKELVKRDGINGCLETGLDLNEIFEIVTRDFNFQKATSQTI